MKFVGAICVVIGFGGLSRATPRLVEPGSYEGLDPRDGLPAAPIRGAPDPDLHLSWIEVEREAREGQTLYAVTFMPSGHVRWEMEVGPLGLTKKVTTVDGELVHSSAFSYDDAGRPLEKRVTFADGGAKIWQYAYPAKNVRERIDRARNVVDERLVYRGHWGFELLGLADDGSVVRRERYDAFGHRTSLSIRGGQATSTTSSPSITTRFVRARDGALRRLLRPDVVIYRPAIGHSLLDGVPQGMSRADVWRLFGPPVNTSESGRGRARTLFDNWAPDCWLNQTSGLEYSADETVTMGHAVCICGLCVAAESQPTGVDIEALDTHLTDGPWVAIDGVVMTAGDYAHQVMTPTGPVAADQLHVGDLVLDARGEPRPVKSVVFLGFDRRPAVNLRTRSGTFTAGDLTVLSEELGGAACAPGRSMPELHSP